MMVRCKVTDVFGAVSGLCIVSRGVSDGTFMSVKREVNSDFRYL